jgi:K+-transporting ATPase KdpF subunit
MELAFQANWPIFRAFRWLALFRYLPRVIRRRRMDGIYLLGGAVALFLFAYLVIALLKPEWFA